MIPQVPKNFRAIILDLDGTLIDSDRYYAIAAASVGFPLDGDLYQNARSAVKGVLPPGHVAARNRFLYFKKLLEQTGEFSPQNLFQIYDLYEKKFFEAALRDENLVEVKKFLAKWSDRCPIAVLTNENLRTQMWKMRVIDPDGLWVSSVVTSEEVGFEKPDRRMFYRALETLGEQSAGCVMIGDSWEDDILGAKAAGLKPVWFTVFEKQPSVGSEKDGLPHVRSWKELDALLEQWGVAQ